MPRNLTQYVLLRLIRSSSGKYSVERSNHYLHTPKIIDTSLRLLKSHSYQSVPITYLPKSKRFIPIPLPMHREYRKSPKIAAPRPPASYHLPHQLIPIPSFRYFADRTQEPGPIIINRRSISRSYSRRSRR